MSWKATAYVSELSKFPDGAEITRDEKLILFILADHHNVSTQDSWPSVALLAKQALMSERHARDILRRAERHGLLECIPGGGRGNTNAYKFLQLDPKPGMACLVLEGDNSALYLPGLEHDGDVNPAQTRHKPGTGDDANKEETRNKKQNLSSASDAPMAGKVGGLHSEIRKVILGRYERHNKIKCPWNGSEAGMLAKLIADNPSWSLEDFQRMVNNRFDSEGINGERPRVWLSNLSRYATSPLDQYNRPKAKPKPQAVPKSASEQVQARLEGR